MKTIYLAGAIHGCSDSEAKDWREETTERLAGHYVIIDPMRRDYRGSEDANVDELVYLDLEDIDNSGIVLVNAERPSWGTAMELWYARDNSVVVHVVCGGRVSPWLRYVATEVHPTLDDAIEHLRKVA